MKKWRSQTLLEEKGKKLREEEEGEGEELCELFDFTSQSYDMIQTMILFDLPSLQGLANRTTMIYIRVWAIFVAWI